MSSILGGQNLVDILMPKFCRDFGNEMLPLTTLMKEIRYHLSAQQLLKWKHPTFWSVVPLAMLSNLSRPSEMEYHCKLLVYRSPYLQIKFPFYHRRRDHHFFGLKSILPFEMTFSPSKTWILLDRTSIYKYTWIQ